MARAIDADELQELCNRRIQDTWNSGTAPVSWAAAYADFKDDIDSMPTLTPPNEPLTLEDAKKERYIWFTPLFQSTHPARGATSGLCVYIPLRLFQSTHPARGATRAALAGHPHADISIHAPREGCDSGHHAPHPQDTRFQSTHPARGATASCHAHL